MRKTQIAAFKFQAIASYEKSTEILLQDEEEVRRPDLLSSVRIHHAQVHQLDHQKVTLFLVLFSFRWSSAALFGCLSNKELLLPLNSVCSPCSAFCKQAWGIVLMKSLKLVS